MDSAKVAYTLSATAAGEGSKSLKPTTSTLSSRYDSSKRVTTGHKIIAPGLFSYAAEQEPVYLPLGWSEHVHPEGQVYFACETTLRVVTEADLHSLEVQEKIAYWVAVVNKLILEHNIRVPETAELFLELTDDACLYYLVDHAARVSFWLEEVTSDLLNLPESVSDSHMRSALEELYWTHVDYFPSHRPDGVNLCVDELTNIFVHARVDQMTSEFSTFPYDLNQCTHFLDSIQSAKDNMPSPYSICAIARLWVVISHHRFTTHYGQKTARLSRDQSILDIPQVRRSWLFALCSRLLFGFPDAYVAQLDLLFLDKMVYANQWREAMAGYRDEWKQLVSWALALMIINVVSLVSHYGSSLIAGASMALCNIAIVSAVTLLVRLQGAAKFVATDAAAYLSDVHGERTGFQTTALAYSLPKALFLWALGVSSLQVLVWFIDATNIRVVLALAAFACACALVARAVSLPRQLWERGFGLARILPCRARARTAGPEICEV